MPSAPHFKLTTENSRLRFSRYLLEWLLNALHSYKNNYLHLLSYPALSRLSIIPDQVAAVLLGLPIISRLSVVIEPRVRSPVARASRFVNDL